MNTPASTDPPPLPSDGWLAIRTWRKRARQALLQRREAVAAEQRRQLGEEARARLTQAIDIASFDVLSFYWPIRGEFDPRSLAERHVARGGRVALPVVVSPSAPLEFWRWYPGIAMQAGVWNIPIPKARELLIPDAVLAPLVGFDRLGYRLGYGGGYFDRTLAAASPQPYAIGIGYAESELETIYPQLHDVRMNLIVTEKEALIP